MPTYIYPTDLGTTAALQNHMTFVAHKIVGARGGAGSTDGAGMRPAFGGALGDVILPIPTGLNIAYAQGWDQAQVGFGAALAAGNFGSELGKI